MGQTPVTDNKAIGIADGLIKAGLSGGADGLRAYLLTTPAAFLLSPVISVFTNKLIDIFGNALYQNGHDLAAKIIIDVQVGLEKSAVSGALDSLKKATTTGNGDAIKKAQAEYEKAIGSLIHSDGSHSA